MGRVTVRGMGFSERYSRPGGVASAGDWRVKQYQVTVTDEPIEAAVVAAAEAYLPKLLPDATDDTPRVAFSVLHKGVDAVWLMVYAWVHGEIVHSRGANAGLSAPSTAPTVSTCARLAGNSSGLPFSNSLPDAATGIAPALTARMICCSSAVHFDAEP